MALPPHLARYSGLVDLLVEQLVEELASDLDGFPETAPPETVASGSGGNSISSSLQEREDADTAAPVAASR